MSRTTQFLNGVAFGYANQALVMLTGLWLTPFLLGRLGQDQYGVWLIGLQVLAYLSLLDFGVVALLPRETAYAVGEDRKNGTSKVTEVIAQAIRVLIYQTPLVMVAATSLWIWMPTQWVSNRGPIGMLIFAFVAAFPLRIFRAVLQGLQDLKFLGLVQTLTWMAGAITTVAGVLGHYGLYSLVAGWVATELLSAGSCFMRLRRNHGSLLRVRLSRLSAGVQRAYLSKCFWVSVSQLAQVFLTGTEIIILGRMFGPGSVVIYSCTVKLLSVLGSQPQMLMQAAVPGLSQMRTGESPDRIVHAATALGQAMLLLSGAVACLVVAVNSSFVHWWVGPKLYGGLPLTLLAAIGMLLRHFNTVLAYTMFSLGFERRLAITNLIDGLMTALSIWLLVPAVGVVGAPLGAMVGTVAVSLAANFSVLTRELGVPPLNLVSPFLPWAWKSILVVCAALVLQRVSSPTLTLVPLASALIGILYFAVNYTTLVRPPLGSYVLPRLKLVFACLREV